MSLFGIHASVLGLGREGSRFEAETERLKEAGFGLLEIPFSRPQDVEPKRIRAAAERLNVELFVSLAGLPPVLDPLQQPEDALDFLEKVFLVCAEAGSFGLGGIVYDTPGRNPGRTATQKEMDGLTRFLERAAKAARGYRLKLGLGPASRSETPLLNRAADGAWLVERMGAENVFLQLDTAAMHAEEENWTSAFETAAPFLGLVDLSESNRGVPGRGLLDWTAAFKALADIGFSGPLVWRGTPLTEIAAGRVTGRRPDESSDELLEIGAAFLREKAEQAGVPLRS